MTWPELEYSKSQVKRAGKILREHHTQILSQSEDDVVWATSVARNWRQSHAEAENWAQMGCRSRLGTIGIEGDVTQRLKELPTIVRKLVREHPRVQLSTMEDIAGARTVVVSVDDARALAERWRQVAVDYPIRRDRDYIDDPPSSGYRAIHLVLQHKDRLVEVQIRTQIQNAWAELVEDVGHLLGVATKNGEGPADVLEGLRALGSELASLEPTHQYAGDADEAASRISQFWLDVQQRGRSTDG